MGIAIAAFLVILVIGATLFINLSPQFGAGPSEAQQQQYATSEHYKDGIFLNEISTSRDIGFVNTLRVLYDFFFNELPGLEPESPIAIEKIDSLQIIRKPEELKRLTWFGHSACLLEMEGKKIFFDPMLGESPCSPSVTGPKTIQP